MAETVTVQVRLDEKTFLRFALFDTFRVKGAWRRPALFSAIFLAFAAVAQASGHRESALIVSVLLLVGLGLPAVYLAFFLSQVRAQARRSRLTPPRLVYTVSLAEAGVTVERHQQAEEPLSLPWQDLWRAYRRRGCVYLYASRSRAFLLPCGQADAPDGEVWALLLRQLGKDRCRP